MRSLGVFFRPGGHSACGAAATVVPTLRSPSSTGAAVAVLRAEPQRCTLPRSPPPLSEETEGVLLWTPSSSSSFVARTHCAHTHVSPRANGRSKGSWSTSCRRALSTSGDTVFISQRRLDEFLEAERRVLSRGDYHKISVKQILQCRDAEHLAPLILAELPARFATRLEQIENTCSNWREIPGLQELHATILESFIALQNLDAGTSSSSALTQVVEGIRSRHGPIVSLVATAALNFKRDGVMEDQRISKWVLQFMESRIGTEMLIHHYLSLLDKLDEDRVGIVDTKCNPARICSDVVEHVRRNFAGQTVQIKLQMEGADIEFSFVTEYLFFIVEELLINSVKATKAFKPPGMGAAAQLAGRAPKIEKNVVVSVCADQKRLTIKISDKGGGIPYKLTDRIWEYMFTTVVDKQKTEAQESGSLAGTGLGLPLCKLFTEYLGGELQLFTMPGIGVDVYINFKRINLIDADAINDL